MLPSLFRTARSAWQLDAPARRHPARALVALAAVRVLLRVVPYASLRRAILRLPVRTRMTGRMTPDDCARAIERAAHVLRGTRCLPRALAAEALLRRDGRAADLSLGVAIDEADRLQAHAWLICNGTIVTGARDAARFTPLLPPPSL